MYGVRQRDAKVGGEVPRLRGVEYHRGAGGGPEKQACSRREKCLSLCEGSFLDRD